MTSPAAAACAVIGIAHDIKGTSLAMYVVLKPGYEASDDIRAELKLAVATDIGKFAKPDHVIIVPGMPLTRSGKQMRRILRKVATGDENLGDISTLADPSVVGKIVAAAKEAGLGN